MAWERVVFVREGPHPSHRPPEPRAPTTLSPAAAHMIERQVAELDLDRDEAVTALLNAFAASRRLAIVDRSAAFLPTPSPSAVDLIREERDGR